MTVQEAMQLSDQELLSLGLEDLLKWHDAYIHFQSTKEFALKCKKLTEGYKNENYCFIN